MNILLRIPVCIICPDISNPESCIISRKIILFKRDGRRYYFVLFLKVLKQHSCCLVLEVSFLYL